MSRYMEFAKELADQNLLTNNGGPFGAVVTKRGVVVGTGNNQVLKSNDPTAHAEVIAIRNACKNLETYDLSDCELYTSCYPCPMCLSAIIWSNIKTVHYGNTKEDAANIGFRDDMIYNFIKNMDNENQTSNVLKLYQLDREETIKTFKDYEAKMDKTLY